QLVEGAFVVWPALPIRNKPVAKFLNRHRMRDPLCCAFPEINDGGEVVQAPKTILQISDPSNIFGRDLDGFRPRCPPVYSPSVDLPSFNCQLQGLGLETGLEIRRAARELSV